MTNPYPPKGWRSISNFRYETPLHLRRDIEAVKGRTSGDALYVVAEPYRVTFALDFGQQGGRFEIVVPEGMLTDLSSVPSIARSMIGRVGPHLEASIVHDYLYIAWQDIEGRGPREEDRAFADRLMLIGMEAAKVPWLKRRMIYQAVRNFGGRPFNSTDPVRYA